MRLDGRNITVNTHYSLNLINFFFLHLKVINNEQKLIGRGYGIYFEAVTGL